MKKLITISAFLACTMHNHVNYTMHSVHTAKPQEHLVDAGIATSYYQSSSHNQSPSPAAIAELHSAPIFTNEYQSLKPIITRAQDDLIISSQIPAKKIKRSQSLSSLVPDSTNTLIAQPADGITIDQEHATPIYDAQGKKVSEHIINHDGSEQHTIFDNNGDTITTTLDKNKKLQQKQTLQPDGSSIVQHFDTQGKQESVETINPDGSKVHVFNTNEGDIFEANIYNKIKELEGHLQVDDYGNTTTTTYDANRKPTSHTRMAEPITEENDDETTTTTTYDLQGTKTEIIRNNLGKIQSMLIQDEQGNIRYEQYNADERIILFMIGKITESDEEKITTLIHYTYVTNIDKHGNGTLIITDNQGNQTIEIFKNNAKIGQNISKVEENISKDTWLNLPKRTIQNLYEKLPSLITPQLRLSFAQSTVLKWLTFNVQEQPTSQQAATVKAETQNFAELLSPTTSLEAFTSLIQNLSKKLITLFTQTAPVQNNKMANEVPDTNADKANTSLTL